MDKTNTAAKTNNILGPLALRDCTGCGICAAVCPTSALDISLDSDGFYGPVINESLCVKCGLCLNSCYKFDDNLIQSNEAEICYAAVNKNKQQLKSSSSGGVSRLLMEECINNGYKVFGCIYDNNEHIAKSVVVDNYEDLDLFYGSKYFQSNTLTGFKEILSDRSKQKYAIFGTPCQIYGFSKTKKYQMYPDRYLLVDIFCHGCPSMKLWQAYLRYVQDEINSKEFDKITFRSKSLGWHEFCFDFHKKDAVYTTPLKNNYFYDIFFNMDVMNEACYDCNVRSSMAYGDIRLGDYWGAKYDLDREGVSAVVLKTPKGVLFFDAIKDKMTYEECSLDHILLGQSYGKKHTYNSERRQYLLVSLDSQKLKDVTKKYIKMFPFTKRFKRHMKNCIKSLPPQVYLPIKKILHSI